MASAAAGEYRVVVVVDLTDRVDEVVAVLGEVAGDPLVRPPPLFEEFAHLRLRVCLKDLLR
ncbi:hypothetical protein AXA44_43525 [Rhodococcus sp. SC4]|nr:hypothetical protein AXA44_43525 [Rhodococcus sp. SC4]